MGVIAMVGRLISDLAEMAGLGLFLMMVLTWATAIAPVFPV
jgi:hypothetical protein